MASLVIFGFRDLIGNATEKTVLLLKLAQNKSINFVQISTKTFYIFRLFESFSASKIAAQVLFCLKVVEEEKNKSLGCVISPACQLKSVFFEALTAFINVLERYTLADILNNEDELATLLFR